MNKNEIYDWIEREIKGRWPDCDITQAMKDDLYKGLAYVDKEIATMAVEAHRADTQAKYPNTARICRMAQAEQKKGRPVSVKNWLDTFCYAVFDETGFMGTLIVRSGIEESLDNIRSRANTFFGEPYFGRFGRNWTTYVGEKNFRAAQTESLRLKKVIL